MPGSPHRCVGLLCFVCVILSAAAITTGDPVLYGTDAHYDVLFMLDPTDGSSIEIGPTGVGQIVNIALADERLLAMERNLGLHAIDPATGQASLIASLPVGYDSGSALAYDPTTSRLYAALADAGDGDQRALVELDPLTGTVVQRIGTLPMDGDGMAVDPISGQMYALSVNGDTTDFWVIDKTDASGVNLGVTGLIRPQGMAFHPQTHELFIAEGGAQDIQKSLFTINPHDLSTTFIGDLDYWLVGGLAYTPEPSTALLLAIGAAGVLRRGRR